MLRIMLGALFLVNALSLRLKAEGLEQRTWKVDGTERTALVYFPPKASKPTEATETNKHPVIFVFHGHGGTGRHAARSFNLQAHWPEAVCVYPQGLNTPGRLTDLEGKKAGWQHSAGDHADRDLKFFDAMLKNLKDEVAIDDKQIFSTGHSNGGGFTYLLWAERGDMLAAVAPSASAAGRRLLDSMKPKPVLHIGAENDGLVKFAWQSETISAVATLNKCTAEVATWKDPLKVRRSAVKAPVVTFIHTGAHAFPAAAPELIVRFFKGYSEIPDAQAP